MMQLAKSIVYWPGIDANIEDFVYRCPACPATKPNNKREPLLPCDIPDAPWEKLGADFFTCDGQKYLLIIDYFSKYLYVPRMTSTNSETTINKFKEIFSIEGAPKTLITDNGPPFNSAEFKQFCQQWNFEHITSTPNYPQLAGQAEHAVQTVKQRLETSSFGTEIYTNQGPSHSS